MNQTVPQGIYRHYKGSLYQVLHTAQHSETEESLVVYRCLYGEYGVWVRPLAMFAETVTVVPTGAGAVWWRLLCAEPLAWTVFVFQLFFS